MKSFFISVLILFYGLHLTAQNTNRISVFYGFASNEIISQLDGSPSFNGKGSDSFGFTFEKNIYKSLSIEMGIAYSKNKIEITPSYPLETHLYPSKSLTKKIVNIEMISIPVYAKFTFLKYFYANAGPIIDIEINKDDHRSIDEQSGIGFGLGIGGQYSYQNLTFFINPILRYHAVIPLPVPKENHNQNLTDAGIKLGIGYNF